LRRAGVLFPPPGSSYLLRSLCFSPRTREEIRINMNDELRTHLSTCLSSVSLRCSRLDTGETQIHIKGFLRAHLRSCNLLDTGGNLTSSNDELHSYLLGEELRDLRRELSTALVTLHVLGKEISSRVSSDLGILKLSSEFSSGLGLRNVLPASEDDVIHMLRRVSSVLLLEIRRGNLRLRCGQFVVDLSLLTQQACRRRFLELESKRATGLKIANSLRDPRSLISAVIATRGGLERSLMGTLMMDMMRTLVFTTMRRTVITKTSPFWRPLETTSEYSSASFSTIHSSFRYLGS
jgi:hypothetical protein